MNVGQITSKTGNEFLDPKSPGNHKLHISRLNRNIIFSLLKKAAILDL